MGITHSDAGCNWMRPRRVVSVPLSNLRLKIWTNVRRKRMGGNDRHWGPARISISTSSTDRCSRVRSTAFLRLHEATDGYQRDRDIGQDRAVAVVPKLLHTDHASDWQKQTSRGCSACVMHRADSRSLSLEVSARGGVRQDPRALADWQFTESFLRRRSLRCVISDVTLVAN
jgi:hypothetical protein